MEFVLTETDKSTLVKWDKDNNLLKTFNPDHYRIISEKEYQRMLSALNPIIAKPSKAEIDEPDDDGLGKGPFEV